VYIAKLQALQTELSQTKRELADQQAEMSTLDEKGVEASEQLEMVMLDKEVCLHNHCLSTLAKSSQQ
jgi:Tfp pilus assembly protein FimV